MRVSLLLVLCAISHASAWRGLNAVSQLGKQALKRALVVPLIAAQLCCPSGASASEGVPVYFGVGCFWHVQHEFVQAEKNSLGRTDEQIT
ncbi:hypothetical protein B484DRAFT_391183, partial [Ochromonadaceae sp. CCMP2298]